MLAFLQALTGIASFVTQTGHVMTVALNEPIFGLYTPIVITICQLVGTFISVPLLYHLQWKTLTLIGGFTCALFNGSTGLFLFLYQNNQSFRPYGVTLTLMSIMMFMFTFGVTVGSSVWPYISYMMPSRSILFAQVFNWLLAGTSIILFSV